jgi:hypothetical protein
MTRFNRVVLFALLFVPTAAVVAAPPTTRPLAEYVQRHTRSLEGRAFDIWRNPGRFTKNPDIIELPTGRMMLVYSDTERHLSQEDQYLVLLASDDQGKTWRKQGVVDSHDMRKGEERLVTPRLSILKDGRLVVLIDMDDWGHFHEDQPSGIMCYWSTDNGQTWSKPQLTGVNGFEPDRVQDMPDGSLAFAAHVMRGETQEFADVMYVSTDAGKNVVRACDDRARRVLPLLRRCDADARRRQGDRVHLARESFRRHSRLRHVLQRRWQDVEHAADAASFTFTAPMRNSSPMDGCSSRAETCSGAGYVRVGWRPSCRGRARTSSGGPAARFTASWRRTPPRHHEQASMKPAAIR